jgi:parvulin-like peptidyl-prolyl isomerase
MLQFSPDSFTVDTTRIGSADIEAYYKGHPDEFSGPEEVKVGVLLIPRKPDESDFAAARERLRGVLDMARATPDSFPSLARAYSEMPTATRGGDPGNDRFIDDLNPIVRNGLKNVAAGQISDVVQQERSVHIFKVETRGVDPDSKREKVRYREIMMRVNPGPNAVRAIRELTAKARREAEREGFGSVATRHGFRTYDSQFFSIGKSGNTVLERFPEVEAWMFRARIGSLSRPVPSENGWFLYKILERWDEGVRPLAKITDEAKEGLIRSLKIERAREAAAQARAALAAGGAESVVAGGLRGRSDFAEGLTRSGYISVLGAREPKVVGALFSTPVATWSQPLVGDAGAYLAFVESRTTPTEEEFRAQEQQIRESLLQERQQMLYTEWMQDVRRRAKIKDYRESYFDA